MKASFKFILAALAATAALAACTKEITPPDFENDKIVPASEGSRVIVVSFAPQTKTTLYGLQPKFSLNDSILISNGEVLDTCNVKIDDKTGAATISTDLTGPLTAVYPYKAAKMNGDNANQIDSVLVSTEQDGTFASANICMAKNISEDAKAATFENKTALFCITPGAGSGTQYVEVSAEGFSIANSVLAGSEFKNYDKIHVATTTADSVWVSILVPENLTIGGLSFYDGTNVKAVTTGAKASEYVAVNTLYKVTDEGWKNPEADIPEGALKGVFTVSAGPDGIAGTDDDIKVHFSQGNLRYVVATQEWSFYEHQYDFCNTATYTGHHADTISLFTWGYDETKSVIPNGVQYVEDHSEAGEPFDKNEDWGYVFGGESSVWRTLTIDEWQYLFAYTTMSGANADIDSPRYNLYKTGVTVCGIANCVVLLPDGWTWDANTVGTGWQTDYPITSTQEFPVTWQIMQEIGAVCFPATGFRNNGSSVVLNVNVGSYYWSSSAKGNDFAYSVCFASNGVNLSIGSYRYRGYSVRLVTDVSAAPAPSPAAGAFIIDTDNANGINPTSFSVKPSDREFTYWIGRNTSENACTVPIINHSDSRFTVPSSVTFSAGETQAPLVITFSDTLPEEDCMVSFEIDEAYASSYGSGSFSFTGVLNGMPFYKRVLGNYTSDEIHDYFGENVTFNFNVVPSQDNPTEKVVIENLEPYFADNGYTAEGGYNSPYGLLDEDNSMIIVPVQGVGYQTTEFVGFDDSDPEEAGNYDDIYIRFEGDNTLIFTNAWGIFSSGGWYTLYYGGFSCKKNTATIQKGASCSVTPMTLPLPLPRKGKVYSGARKF